MITDKELLYNHYRESEEATEAAIKYCLKKLIKEGGER